MATLSERHWKKLQVAYKWIKVSIYLYSLSSWPYKNIYVTVEFYIFIHDGYVYKLYNI
jgi:hypothetical protein